MPPLFPNRARSPHTTGSAAALIAALLFGATTPIAKGLLGAIDPFLLASLLYLGAGAGLALWRAIRGGARGGLGRGEKRWLLLGIFAGGIAGPLLLLWGLAHQSASVASLLLNAEAIFTALIAWVLFHERVGARLLLALLTVVAGAVVLVWPKEAHWSAELPALAILASSLAWALDNNFTRRIAHADATFVIMVKGSAAGVALLVIALAHGAELPSLSLLLLGAGLGVVGYGCSLVAFVIALRHLGAARTAGYFATAPFIGAAIAIPLLDEPVTGTLLAATVLMAAGVALLLTEERP